MRQRPWPTIQGYLCELDEAIAWFEHLAAISGIMLVRLAPGTGQAGLYSLQERAIYLADELFELPPLYGWVLAHELGHASIRASKPSVQWSTANPNTATGPATTNWSQKAPPTTHFFLRSGSVPRQRVSRKHRRQEMAQEGDRPRQGRSPSGRGRHSAQTAATRDPEQQREHRKAQANLQGTIRRLDKRLRQEMAVHNFTQDPFSRQAILDLWR